MLHVFVPHDLADSHPEYIEVPKHAAAGTLSLFAVAVAISGNSDGLEQGAQSASKRVSSGL